MLAQTDPTQSVDAAMVMARAQAATGLTDFGRDRSFLAGLDIVMRDAAAMPPERRMALIERVTGLLVARLRIVEDDRLFPEIRAQAIERPMFVVGLPRTGTTITYDMLALDDATRWPREWEQLIPWPATEAATIDSDPRIALIQPLSDAFVSGAPELLNVHRFDCRAPGECNGMMMYHFSSTNFWAEAGARGHAEWMIDTIPAGHFADHKRLLQQMQWKGPKGRWLLKSPQHLFHLPALFETYPDARIVWTHRDPVATFSSLSSMISLIHRAFGIATDPFEVGDVVRRTWSRAILNAVADRAAHPEIDRAIIDQPHKAIVVDPYAAMRANLAFLDQPMSPTFRARLDAFLNGDAKSQRAGKHKHAPEQFGLDPERIRRDLAAYYARFGDLIA